MVEVDNMENVFQLIEECKDKEIMIVDYYADWCKPCKGQSVVLKTVEGELKDKDVLFAKFNVEKE